MHVETSPESADRSRIGAKMSAEDFIRTGSKVGAHHGGECAIGGERESALVYTTRSSVSGRAMTTTGPTTRRSAGVTPCSMSSSDKHGHRACHCQNRCCSSSPLRATPGTGRSSRSRAGARCITRVGGELPSRSQSLAAGLMRAVEIAVVIGKAGRAISVKDAMEYVAGYGQ